MDKVFSEMKVSCSHVIVVRAGWRMSLLIKSIEAWPLFVGEERRFGVRCNFYYGLASIFLFSLFHNHIRAISNGYSMRYEVTSDSIRLGYFLSN